MYVRHLQPMPGLNVVEVSVHTITTTPELPHQRPWLGPRQQKGPNQNHARWQGLEPCTSSGANGTRTRNPLLAKQVRYQLRHSPVGEAQSSTTSVTDIHRSALSERSRRICRTTIPTATTDPTATQHVTSFFMMILRSNSPADGGPRWVRTTDLSLIRTAL